MSWSSGADATVRRSWLAVLAVLVIAGCSAPAGSGPPASPRISCNGVPQAKCDEAVASVARSLPNTHPAAIEVMCVSGTCTPESGAMDTILTLADGSTLRSSTIPWGTGGVEPGGKPTPAPPIPVPELPVAPECLGVPLGKCQEMAQTALVTEGGKVIVGIVVRCTVDACTDQGGEGETVITLADGSTSKVGWAYASAR